jgi:hypothetical protein
MKPRSGVLPIGFNRPRFLPLSDKSFNLPPHSKSLATAELDAEK